MTIRVLIKHIDDDAGHAIDVDVFYRDTTGEVQQTPLRTITVEPGASAELMVYSRQVLLVREKGVEHE
jgi:hypothetical protein